MALSISIRSSCLQLSSLLQVEQCSLFASVPLQNLYNYYRSLPPVSGVVQSTRATDMNGYKGLLHFNLKSGTLVAINRVYTDYKQFGTWTMQGVYFVTKMKKNTKYPFLKTKIPPYKKRYCVRTNYSSHRNRLR